MGLASVVHSISSHVFEPIKNNELNILKSIDLTLPENMSSHPQELSTRSDFNPDLTQLNQDFNPIKSYDLTTPENPMMVVEASPLDLLDVTVESPTTMLPSAISSSDSISPTDITDDRVLNDDSFDEKLRKNQQVCTLSLLKKDFFR